MHWAKPRPLILLRCAHTLSISLKQIGEAILVSTSLHRISVIQASVKHMQPAQVIQWRSLQEERYRRRNTLVEPVRGSLEIWTIRDSYYWKVAWGKGGIMGEKTFGPFLAFCGPGRAAAPRKDRWLGCWHQTTLVPSPCECKSLSCFPFGRPHANRISLLLCPRNSYSTL